MKYEPWTLFRFIKGEDATRWFAMLCYYYAMLQATRHSAWNECLKKSSKNIKGLIEMNEDSVLLAAMIFG